MAELQGSLKRQAESDPFHMDEGDETVESKEISVGAVAARLADLPSCSPALPLRDVVSMLLSTGRAAAVVAGDSGAPEGLIAEDDILRSYLQSAPWDVTVAEWMRGGGGVSLPSQAKSLAGFSVPPEQPLKEALSSLLALPSGSSKDCQGAGSGVLLVQGGEGGYKGGVLAASDVAKAVAERGRRMRPEAPASIADIMEPMEEVPALAPGFTMQQLLHQLLSSPDRAVLVSDGGGVRGLATASDAMWAFREQIAHNEDAWEKLSARPGRAGLEARKIPKDTPPEQAAAAMVSCSSGSLRALLVVEPTAASSIVGLVTPWHLIKTMSESAAPQSASTQGVAQVRVRLLIPRRHMRLHKRRRVSRPHAVTVGDIVAQRETATCLTSHTLVDAADTLVESGRSAAVVMDASGEVRGVLSENDLLTALLDGTPWDCDIDTWLRGGHARLPGFMVPALTLSPSVPLAEAAAEMTAQVEDGAVGTGFACHHLLVRGVKGEDGKRQVRLLSALDVAKGMIDAVAAQAAGAHIGIEGHAVIETSDMTVEQAMKERGICASCKLTDTLQQAFEAMFELRQNCAIVVPPASSDAPGQPSAEGVEGEVGQGTEGKPGDQHPCAATGKAAEDEDWQREHGCVHGVITAADALREFSERQRGQLVTVAGWLRALTSKERKTAAQRTIRADESLSDAALAMGMSDVHHLVVLDRAGKEVVGVLSALDIVCTLGACYRFDLASPRGL